MDSCNALGKFLLTLLGIWKMNDHFYIDPPYQDKVRCIPAKRYAHNEVMGSLLQASLYNVIIY